VSDGVEPFTGAELRRYFEREYGARFVRQTGSHVSMEMPDGRVLRCMDDRTLVTKVLMRWNAKVLGMTYAALRSQIAPIQKRNRPRFRTQTHSQRVVTKKEALASLDQLIGEARVLKDTICNGDRDPVVYRRVRDAAGRARGSLRSHEKVRR